MIGSLIVLAALVLGGSNAQSLGPFPLEGLSDWAYQQAKNTPLKRPTGLGRKDALGLASDIVFYFRQFQNAEGAIIDPIQGIEIQYTTPTYALTCATLIANNFTQGQKPNLLGSCISALNSSIVDVSAGTAPQGHNNFFIKPVMLTLPLLRDSVSTSTMAYWNATLKTLDPYTSYHGFQTNNWGIVAASFDYLRVAEGLCTVNCTWWSEELSRQFANTAAFTGNGMYQDHTGTDGLNPMPYDEFPRGYISSMRRVGYDGEFSELIDEIIARGLEMSMLMQTPRGDIPTGGRSQMHAWNQGTAFELYMLRARDMVLANNMSKACQYKRAANLALESLLRFRTPPAAAGMNGSGTTMFVNMNFFPMEDEWGWMSYTSASQYATLPLAKICTALLLAPEVDDVEECSTYADVGGFSYYLPEFHKVFANAGGTSVQIETAADPHYDSTGLTRVQVSRPSDASTPIGAPNMLGPLSGSWWEHGALALGPVWTLDPSCFAGKNIPLVDSLANQTYADITAVEHVPKTTPIPNAVAFTVTYSIFNKGIQILEDYTIQPNGIVNVTVSATAPEFPSCATPFQTFGISVPALIYDGKHNTTISIHPSNSSVTWSHPDLGFTTVIVPPVSNNDPITWSQNPKPIISPNGLLANITTSLYPKTANPSMSFQLQTYAP